ncbi:MAG: hypothetical protein HRT88_03885 [Lentisphaeraceae bacterium]|nr:hypothetical protein [Lentisphaeraceae bacterium]
MNKALCKLGKKGIEENFKEISRIVANPNYLCRKCGRSASSKKYLCKGVSL